MEKIALITGASRGLGAALAQELAPDYHVIAVARTVGALEDLDDAIKAKGGACTLAPMDVADPNAMAQLCRSIFDRWGQIALWAHTAIHVPPLAPVDSLDTKDWAKSIALNTTSMGHLIPYIAPLLGQDGQAVFFDDPHHTGKFFGAYAASKAAQMTLCRSWAAETANLGPKVQIVTPAPMPTATRARFFPGEDRSQLTPPMECARKVRETLGL